MVCGGVAFFGVFLSKAIAVAGNFCKLGPFEHTENPDDIDARFAAAEQKRIAMVKEAHVDKIEKLAAEHEEKRNPTPDEPPADPKDQMPDDDRAKYGRFDPSSGDFSQKTKAHPAGDSVFRRHQIEAAENRAFREREKAMILDIKDKIAASNKARWQ